MLNQINNFQKMHIFHIVFLGNDEAHLREKKIHGSYFLIFPLLSENKWALVLKTKQANQSTQENKLLRERKIITFF